MKFSHIIFIAIVPFILGSCFHKRQCCEVTAVPIDSLLKIDDDTMAYIIGTQIGAQLNNELVQFDLDAISRGISDAVNKHDTLFTPQEKQLFQEKFQQKLMLLTQKAQEDKALKNKEEQETFLTENKLKKGVVETSSGLQYKVLNEYRGVKPTPSDTVKVYYEGKFLDGEIFDGNFETGNPMIYPLGGFIQGWIEGLQLMSEGSTFLFWIPAELAYGERGNQNIPPAKLLVFKVQLVDVVGKD